MRSAFGVGREGLLEAKRIIREVRRRVGLPETPELVVVVEVAHLDSSIRALGPASDPTFPTPSGSATMVKLVAKRQQQNENPRRQ